MQWESATLGRYRLVERLAAGGMAEVYLARMQSDGGLEKTVVVKTILPELTGSEDVRNMMLDEARIGFALRHQNIAQVLDVGREGDTLYVAIEHIDGLDMARFHRECQRAEIDIDPMVVAWIGVEVLRALDYAHRRKNEAGAPMNIVHRDITPHNVLLSVEGEVKLTDFGIARARDRLVKTTTGSTKGKLAYMAPEQGAGAALDQRADLFGVAASLYEMLCGAPPFDGASAIEILGKLKAGVVQPLAERCPDLDPLLAGIIDQALSKDPAARPATAAAMRRPLEELLRGHAVSGDNLSALVQQACAAESSHAGHDQAFRRAILGVTGSETGTGSNGFATGTHAGTASPSPSAVTGRVAKPTRSRKLGWPIAVILAMAAGAAGAILLTQNDTPNAPIASAPATSTTTPSPPTTTSPTPTPTTTPTPDAGAPAATPPRAKRKTRRRKPKPKPADSKKTGTVTITSLPWARVTIDGKYVGNTPIRGKSLSVGRHNVVLENPSTGQRAKRRVDIVAGKQATLRIEL